MAIYFDNSATTRVRPEVIDAMLPFLTEGFGNPSSLHRTGRESFKAVATARKEVAELLGCSAAEVSFSPCGTMSNNLAILGRARFVEANGGGRHLITSSIEHPSVIGPCRFLESRGWTVTTLGVDSEGFVNLDEFEKALSSETSIVSIMWANNEIGTVQPIREIGEIIERFSKKTGKEIFFHTDAVQAAGKLDLNLENTAVSALSISGHKFHAPKGIGALFLRRGMNVMPITFGGGQEKGMIPGTEGVHNIVAIGRAAGLARETMVENMDNLRKMQTFLIERLSKLENVNLTGTSDLERRLPGHVSIAVENAEGEALVMQLDLKGICVSSASACHTGVIEPSHVLSALCVPSRMVKGSLRISLGCFNTMDECKTAIDVMEQVFASSRATAASS